MKSQFEFMRLQNDATLIQKRYETSIFSFNMELIWNNGLHVYQRHIQPRFTNLSNIFRITLYITFLLIFLWDIPQTSFAVDPTVKSSGLVVVCYNCDANSGPGTNGTGQPEDSFAVVALDVIPANSVIFFTDNGMISKTFNIARTDSVVTWNTGVNDIPAGSIIRIDPSAGPGNEINFGLFTAGAAGLSFFSLGDQLMIYQTLDNTPSGEIQRLDSYGSPEPGMIYAFNTNVDENAHTYGWSTNVSYDRSASESELPLNLNKMPDEMIPVETNDGSGNANEANAFGQLGLPPEEETDNYRYDGPTTSADRSTWLSRIHTVANWSRDNSTPFALDGGSIAAPFDIIVPNNPPIASDNTVTIDEDMDKIFIVSEFNFLDDDLGDELSKIQITTTPAIGTLYNDANANSVVDTIPPTEIINDDSEISKTDIDAGQLKFKPIMNDYGSPYATFEFKVHDGIEYSTSASTMTIIVNSIDDPITVDPNIEVILTGYLADLTAVFSDPDMLSPHTATIDWGDGVTAPGVVTFGWGSEGVVTGSHTYTGDGVYSIVVTIVDKNGDTVSETVTISIFSYLVNGDGSSEGSGKYWPGDQGYLDAWLTAMDYIGGDQSNPEYPFYPAWCADLDTWIRLAMWYNNVGIYSSLTSECSLIDNPDNLDLVNYMLVNYRTGTFNFLGATDNEIQAVIWRLLFNSDFGWDTGGPKGGITWDIIIADEIYQFVLAGSRPSYDQNNDLLDLPIVVIIDCGDQVNLIEIPYWLYEELVNEGIIDDCQ